MFSNFFTCFFRLCCDAAAFPSPPPPCLSFPIAPRGRGGRGVFGEGCLERVFCSMGRVWSWDELGTGRPSQNQNFLPIPGLFQPATPPYPTAGIPRVASPCPTCLLHPRVLPACQPLPSCANTPRPLPALARWHPTGTGGSSELAGLRVAEPCGTAAPAVALPIPAVTGLLGRAPRAGDTSWSPQVGWDGE